nr:polymorphic toxin type 23 domain-containing protein [Tenacibaculum maritimum]
MDFEYGTTLLNRGYTGHEHFMGVALIHMNGRMYDAKLGRFLSPDNFIQEPFSTQSFNRFGYVWNNPLKFTDPSGEEFITAVLIGALIGATVGAMGYIINAAITGQWNWGNFGMSILGGAISGAIGGAIGPTALFKSILTNGFWGTAAIAAASSFLPSLDVKIGDFSFGLSPALAFGRATGFGVNVSASYQDGDFTFSAGYGVTFYGTAHGTGKKGWEYRKSWGVNWDDGKQGFGIHSTNFKSGETSQKVGGISYRNGDFGFRYENDGAPFGGTLGDGSDRFRTAAVSINYKDYSVGFNLFTGSRTDYSGDEEEMAKGTQYGKYNEKMPAGFVKEDGEAYRLGALYFGYKGFRLGIDSDRRVRHPIQDIGAHWWISKQPGFYSYSDNIAGYFQYQSFNPYTLW